MKKLILSLISISTIGQAAVFDACVCSVETETESSFIVNDSLIRKSAGYYLNGFSFVKKDNGSVEKAQILITFAKVDTDVTHLESMCSVAKDQLVASNICPKTSN